MSILSFAAQVLIVPASQGRQGILASLFFPCMDYLGSLTGLTEIEVLVLAYSNMDENIYCLSPFNSTFSSSYTAGLFSHSFQSTFFFWLDLDSWSSPTFITLLLSLYLSHLSLIHSIDIDFVHTAAYNYHGSPDDSFFLGPFGCLCRPSRRSVWLRHLNTLLVHIF